MKKMIIPIGKYFINGVEKVYTRETILEYNIFPNIVKLESNEILFKKALKRLNKIELCLEKVRGCSPLIDGWQTQRYANKSRKWDELGNEKLQVLKELGNLGYNKCPNCKRWHNETDYSGFCCTACECGY